MKPKKLTEKKVDRIVISQGQDDSMLREPVNVRCGKPASLVLPVELAACAAFLARLHHSNTLEEWLTHSI
jgi:hypothetical protein